jgi:hypothetical protein
MLRFGSEGVPGAVIVDASFGLRDGSRLRQKGAGNER